MSANNWRCYIYEISDTLKYALGEYCLSLYKVSNSTGNYLTKIIGHYKSVNNRPIRATNDNEFLKQTETRSWLRLIKKDLDTRLAAFVQDPTQRPVAENYLNELITEYNAVYHQQELDYAEALATATKSLQLLRLTDTGSPTIDTAIRSIDHIIAKMQETYSGATITAHRQNSSRHQANGNGRTPIIDESLPIPVLTTVPHAGNALPIFNEADEEQEQPYTEMIQPWAQYTLLARTADGRRIEKVLSRDEFVVGRSTKADLTLDDPFMSLQHIKICCQNEQVYLIDLGSKNGTTLNRAKITSHIPIPWRIEQPVVIGHTRLTLAWTT